MNVELSAGPETFTPTPHSSSYDEPDAVSKRPPVVSPIFILIRFVFPGFIPRESSALISSERSQAGQRSKMKPHNSFHCEYFVVSANSLFTLIVPKRPKDQDRLRPALFLRG